MKKSFLATLLILCTVSVIGYLGNEYYLKHKQLVQNAAFWDIGSNEKVEETPSENEFWDLPETTQVKKSQ